MGHGHDHGHGGGPSPVRDPRPLRVALALTAAFLVAEVVAGVLAGSLALLADAGHMLSDVASLALALGAIRLARRPPTPNRSFGYGRAEVLAAFFNGAALAAVGVWVVVEAIRRIPDPGDPLGGPMLVVAVLGLLVNAGAAAALWRAGRESLNMQAALRHVLADAAGSVGVVAAAVVILTTGWREADPVAGLLIGLLVAASSWTVLREAVRVLLEASPAGIDADRVGTRMVALDGVDEVHDLHVWTITSGFPAMSAHVLVGHDADCHERRRALEGMLGEEFGIHHTTLQVDHTPPLLEVRTSSSADRPTERTPH